MAVSGETLKVPIPLDDHETSLGRIESGRPLDPLRDGQNSLTPFYGFLESSIPYPTFLGV